ncbi:hypothetical protein BDY19DRAFT_156675 [Irpex rosettiformis]|uniref:Uncharacterized protein n=1 Tax=Irpex rosettiformis TaxID=378272 RepID=A0ACB8U3K4_9APHY|nr:hypothetical protein BDY19DRAFT_156675 [Irpex rosettiformis]
MFLSLADMGQLRRRYNEVPCSEWHERHTRPFNLRPLPLAIAARAPHASTNVHLLPQISANLTYTMPQFPRIASCLTSARRRVQFTIRRLIPTRVFRAYPRRHTRESLSSWMIVDGGPGGKPRMRRASTPYPSVRVRAYEGEDGFGDTLRFGEVRGKKRADVRTLWET